MHFSNVRIDAEELKTIRDIEEYPFVDYRNIKSQILDEGFRFRIGYTYEKLLKKRTVAANEVLYKLMKYMVNDLSKGPPYGPLNVGDSPVDFIDNEDQTGLLESVRKITPRIEEILRKKDITHTDIHELLIQICREIRMETKLHIAILWDQFEPLIEVSGIDWEGLCTFFNNLTSRSHEENIKVIITTLPNIANEGKLMYETWLSYQRGILTIHILEPLKINDVKYILRELIPTIKGHETLETLLTEIVNHIVWSSRNPGSMRSLYEAIIQLQLHKVKDTRDILQNFFNQFNINLEVS